MVRNEGDPLEFLQSLN